MSFQKVRHIRHPSKPSQIYDLGNPKLAAIIKKMSIYRQDHKLTPDDGFISDPPFPSFQGRINVNRVIRMLTRVLFALVLTLLLLAGSSEAAQKILTLQSVRVAPYDEAIKGLRNVAAGSVKRLVLSDLEGVDVAKAVRDERPDVIVAVGTEAMSRVKKIKDIPIVYLMVFDPQNTLTAGTNITGIGMHVAPERQLASLQGAMPRIRRVGTMYNPARSSSLFRRTQATARSLGIDLVAREVRSSRDVLNLVEGMKGNIEAFLMLPDPIVVTPETVEYLLLFSLNNRIPIITFSDKYVEMGALMALDVDSYDLGRQSGEMVKKILSGTSPANIPRSDPRSAVMTVNSKIARKLGLSLDEEALGRAKVIR